MSDLSTDQQKDERLVLEQINNIVSSGNIYFSYTCDITNSFQRRWSLSEQSAAEPLWKKADDRFFWNKALVQPLVEQALHPWILPVSWMRRRCCQWLQYQ